MHTCKQTLDALLEYLDGDLPAEARAKLDAHFGDCTPCEEFLKTYRATSGLCRRALSKTMPPEFADKLRNFLDEHVHEKAPKKS
jgi:anti-sigma factor RsiW